jgi:hypothetical protein
VTPAQADPQVTAPIDAALPASTTPATPDAAPPPKPTPKKKACKADADHCCLADGTIVKPGGCQPMYPRGVRPATRRGPDGFCQKIPCYKKCLPATARIATPRGEVAVSRLAIGDLVWTVDASGERIAAPIARLASVRVTAPHSVVELSLADGRVLAVSAGHPNAAGQPVGALQRGDRLDGSRVVGRREHRYEGEHTWDLLPAGPTGKYWADGVLLGSTLR